MQKHKIVPALLPLKTPIGGINLNPANTRRHSEQGIELLKTSLKTYGQHKPVVVQKKGMLCRAGNGLLTAAKALGWTHIAATVIEEEAVEATAREIIDNRSAEVGSEWDTHALATQLQSLQDEISLEMVGFSENELSMLLEDMPIPGDDEDENPEDALRNADNEVTVNIVITLPRIRAIEVKELIDDFLEEEGIEVQQCSIR